MHTNIVDAKPGFEQPELTNDRLEYTYYKIYTKEFIEKNDNKIDFEPDLAYVVTEPAEDEVVLRVYDSDKESVVAGKDVRFDVFEVLTTGGTPDIPIHDENENIQANENKKETLNAVTNARGELSFDPTDTQLASLNKSPGYFFVKVTGIWNADKNNYDEYTSGMHRVSIDTLELSTIVVPVTKKAAKFKVTVLQEVYSKYPTTETVEGAYVEILENEGRLYGEAVPGKRIAGPYETNRYGVVDFKNVNLHTMRDTYLEDGDTAKPKELAFNNIIKVTNGSSDSVYYTLKDDDIAKGKAEVILKLEDLTTPQYVGRIEGANRYETAVNIAKELYKDGIVNDTVIIATGENFADALSANSLTHVYEAPILLTRQGSLPEVTYEYLKEQVDEGKVKNAIIVGLNAAVSIDVQHQLRELGIHNTPRLGGENRYETAIKIYNALKEPALLEDITPFPADQPQQADMSKVFIANGRTFPDALIASLPAAQKGHPILLTNDGSRMYEPTRKLLESERAVNGSGIKKVTIIGGTAVVPATQEADINYYNPDRIYGNNRYSTSLNAIGEMYLDVNRLYVATGADYADALVASKLAIENDGAVMLVHPNGLSDEQADYIRQSEITEITIIGGPAVISGKVQQQLNDIILGK